MNPMNRIAGLVFALGSLACASQQKTVDVTVIAEYGSIPVYADLGMHCCQDETANLHPQYELQVTVPGRPGTYDFFVGSDDMFGVTGGLSAYGLAGKIRERSIIAIPQHDVKEMIEGKTCVIDAKDIFVR